MRPKLVLLTIIVSLAVPALPINAQVSQLRASSQSVPTEQPVVTRAMPLETAGRPSDLSAAGVGQTSSEFALAPSALGTGTSRTHPQRTAENNTLNNGVIGESGPSAITPRSGFRDGATISDQTWTAGAATQRLASETNAVPLPERVKPGSGVANIGSFVTQAQYTSPGAGPLPGAVPNGGRGRLEVRNASDAALAATGGERPLKPPTSSELATQTKRSSSTVQMFVSVISSLLIVVGLLLGAAWCYRKATPGVGGSLPKQVVQVLGRTPLAPRQQLVLVRFGTKLVLVSNLQGEVRTISEITDPLEVDRVSGMCESAQSGSISDSFRTVLHNIGRNS